MKRMATRKYFPNDRSIYRTAVLWCCCVTAILCCCHTSSRLLRIVMVVHGFRSIILFDHSWPKPERQRWRHHHHHHGRYPRVLRNNNVARLRVEENNKEAVLLISPDSNNMDDANNVASLRSVTFSHLPKDQGRWYMDLIYASMSDQNYSMFVHLTLILFCVDLFIWLDDQRT